MIFLKLGIKRLLFHPVPKVGDSIGSWIEELASTNQIEFDTLYWHVVSIAQERGFYQALISLTGMSINRISCLTNEFKRDFWKDPKKCPIKNCDHVSHTSCKIPKHLQTQHDIGRILLQCPYCTHQVPQIRRVKLIKHIKLVHGDELKWWGKCPYCDYKPIKKVFFIHHLITVHDIKLPLVDCLYCDYLAKNKLDLKSHLWKAHRVKEDYQCPQCEYRSRSYVDFISHLRDEHAQDKHGSTENRCPYCNYKTQDKRLFKRHLWVKHDIGGKWYICPDPNCSFKSKHQSSYHRHLERYSHGIVKKQKKYAILKENNKYRCAICSNFESKRRLTIRNHLIKFHNAN